MERAGEGLREKSIYIADCFPWFWIGDRRDEDRTRVDRFGILWNEAFWFS